MNIIEFMKSRTSNFIEGRFFDDIFNLYDIHKPYECCIDLDKICLWLNCTKGSLKETLSNSKMYIENIDYCTVSNNNTARGRKLEKILLSYNAFKLLCINSNAKNAKNIADNFFSIDKCIDSYQDYTNIYSYGLKGYFYIVCTNKNVTLSKLNKIQVLNFVECEEAQNNDIIYISLYGVHNVTEINSYIKKITKHYSVKHFNNIFHVNQTVISRLMNEFCISGDNLIKNKQYNLFETSKDYKFYIIIEQCSLDNLPFVKALNIHKKLNIYKSRLVHNKSFESFMITDLYYLMFPIFDKYNKNKISLNYATILNYVNSSLLLKQEVELLKNIIELPSKQELNSYCEPILNNDFKITNNTNIDIAYICVYNKLLYVLPYWQINQSNEPNVLLQIKKLQNLIGINNEQPFDMDKFNFGLIRDRKDIQLLISINELIHETFLNCIENLKKINILNSKKYTVNHLRALYNNYCSIMENSINTKKYYIDKLLQSSYYKYSF